MRPLQLQSVYSTAVNQHMVATVVVVRVVIYERSLEYKSAKGLREEGPSLWVVVCSGLGEDCWLSVEVAGV